MSSAEKDSGTSAARELERRDRRAERNETRIMVIQAVIAVAAVAGLIAFVVRGPLIGAGWAALVALQATAMVYAQRTIRLLRRHAREMQKSLDRAYDLLSRIRRGSVPR